MKVLRVIASMDPASGGPCQGIRNSIPELARSGVENDVVCMDDPNASFVRKDNFPVIALGPAKNPWAYSSELIPWLLNNLLNYDAVIVHGLWLFHGYAVNHVYKQFNGNKPRLYVMPHGMLDPYFQKAGGRKLKAVRNWLYWKLIERKLIHRAEGILFTCEQELVLARNTFSPYQPNNELNVGYGIPEPPPFNPEMSKSFFEQCPEVKDKGYLLFLSRIHEKKGVDLLITAYARLKEKYQQQELPLLVIAGPGMESPYGRRINQQVKEDPSLSNSVFFPGMLTGDAKWGAFYGCEAFILPSHQENFGIAVVEALACGKAVLVSDQVNIWREILKLSGGKVAPDSLEGISALLESWIKLLPGQKRETGDNARNCFIENFSITPNALSLRDAISKSSTLQMLTTSKS